MGILTLLQWGSSNRFYAGMTKSHRTEAVRRRGNILNLQRISYLNPIHQVLNEWECREWKLSTIHPHDRDTWRSGVRCKPVTWKGAHCCRYCPYTCTLIKNLMLMMMMMMMIMMMMNGWKNSNQRRVIIWAQCRPKPIQSNRPLLQSTWLDPLALKLSIKS